MNKPKRAPIGPERARGLGYQGQRLSLANQRRRIGRGRLLRLQHPTEAEHQVMRLDLVERDWIERIASRNEIRQWARLAVAKIQISVGEVDGEVRCHLVGSSRVQ